VSPGAAAGASTTLPNADKTGKAAAVVKGGDGLATALDYVKQEEQRAEEFVSIQDFVAHYDFSTEGLERVVLDLEEAGRMEQVLTDRMFTSRESRWHTATIFEVIS
jgi:hypothetical protein